MKRIPAFLTLPGLLALALLLALPPAQALPPEHSPDPEPGAVWVEPTTGMEFVWIPPGCFIMGSNSTKANPVEKPAHKVCLDGFWMGRFEVTNKQYRAFSPRHDSGERLDWQLNGDQQPVVQVSWNEARKFAHWLSRKTGYRFDLPTEAQWEYAARGGTTGLFYYGDESPCLYENLRNISVADRFSGAQFVECYDGHESTAPVGSFRPNPFGLYDMLGNVMEMCFDSWDPDAYDKHALHNPAMSKNRYDRVERGNCYICGFHEMITVYRTQTSKNGKNWSSGFRLMRK